MVLGLLAFLPGCNFNGPVYAPPSATVISIKPPSVTLTAGRRMTFGHHITSVYGTRVLWSVMNPGGGSVDEHGTYQAPEKPGIYRVNVASVAEPDRMAAATVTVVAPPQGTITAPDRVESGASGLSASVPLQSGITYAWTIEGGRLQTSAASNEIRFAMGQTGPAMLHCRMVNAAGDSLALTREVSMAPPVVFRLTQTNAIVTVGRSLKIGYTLSGGVLPSVYWTLPQPRSGRLEPDGVYTAPWTPGTYLVRAVPDTAPEQAAQMEITVVAAPSGVIFAPQTIEPGRTEVPAWVVARPGLSLEWSISGGRLVGDATASTIHFDLDAGNEVELHCRLTNEAGDTFTATRQVSIAQP